MIFTPLDRQPCDPLLHIRILKRTESLLQKYVVEYVYPTIYDKAAEGRLSVVNGSPPYKVCQEDLRKIILDQVYMKAIEVKGKHEVKNDVLSCSNQSRRGMHLEVAINSLDLA